MVVIYEMDEKGKTSMKRLTKIASFILVCIFISAILSFILTPSSYIRVVIHEVKTAEKPYDLIFVGQSRGESNINPYVLDEVMEYNSYNLCRREIIMPDIPYLIKEANSNDQIDVCILSVDQVYFYDISPDYYGEAFIYPYISNISDKTEYFFRYLLNSDFRASFMRYTLEGTGDLKLSKTRIANKLSADYKEYSMDAVTDTDVDHVYVGRGYRKGIAYADYNISGADWDRDKINIEAIESIKEIKDYCDNRGITMIAIHDPVPHDRFTEDEHRDQNEYFTGLFAGIGVDYLDFNYIDEEYLTWNKAGFSDGEGHMMSDLADRYSLVLGEVLQKKLNGDKIDKYFSKSPNMRED